MPDPARWSFFDVANELLQQMEQLLDSAFNRVAQEMNHG